MLKFNVCTIYSQCVHASMHMIMKVWQIYHILIHGSYIVFFFLFLFFFRILAFHLPSHDSFFFFLNLSFLVLFSAVTLILCRTKGVSGVCLESF